MNKCLMDNTNYADRQAIIKEAWRLGAAASSENIEESKEGKMLLDTNLTYEEKTLARDWFILGFINGGGAR